jgi:hypothetical protein
MLAMLLLLFAAGGAFQTATVIQMDLTDCVTPQHSVLAAIAGEPSSNQTESCAEYVLASPHVVFRIQARKSEMLMVPGEVVSYRVGKGKLHLRRDDNQGELEATVLCMRATSTPGDACGAKTEDFPQTKPLTHARIP